jgi:glycosyltransferase involved in cell wall biosynthesis
VKTITVVAPCFNEEENVRELHARLNAVFAKLPGYAWELVYVDNASTDATVARVKELCAADRRVKLIVNNRNFGHIRSPVHGLLQARGDATILIASDLQDPPELVPELIAKWEAGCKVVFGVKEQVIESWLLRTVRSWYYDLVCRLADVELVRDATGFGLYDREAVETIRAAGDAYPYLRGLVSDLGYQVGRVPFLKPARQRGITKNNFYTLFDMALLGLTSHSKVPLRLATMIGFGMSAASLAVAMGYLVAKLVWWDKFALGMAPLMIGLFFFASVQLFFIGVIGEYVGNIYTQVLRRPLVTERERFGFDEPTGADPRDGGGRAGG